MKQPLDPAANYERTKAAVGYIPRKDATRETYASLGFKSGLEIHQQLLTTSKLFCRCPAGRYQTAKDYDAEVIRHMRPTLSELGEYDGTALMEFKTKKEITYRIKYETACTYEVDDTPPFLADREALENATQIALMLGMNIVGELHITRKQYLDGSIPTGFQRTGIVAIEGSIPLREKTVRLIQLSIEEDSCREVSDIGHQRIYMTDRLGMPLIETVTYPDMLTPDEVAEAAQYLRFVARASGKARTGMGAAREDVNVSVRGGTRVEIKGVAHIKWIPRLVHVEAFRQSSLLRIRDILKERIEDKTKWSVTSKDIDADLLNTDFFPLRQARMIRSRIAVVNLPKFEGILSHFTQPGKSFANELSDRLKVIAGLEKPNMAHTEDHKPVIRQKDWETIRQLVRAEDGDAQIIVWGPSEDVVTAIDTIQERCRLAMEGVPNETRKGLDDGTTLFERVLPGPDRMYPDTDSAPISVDDDFIEDIRKRMPVDVHARMKQLRDWKVPADTWNYLLKRNLVGLVEEIVTDLDQDPVFVASVLAHKLKNVEGKVVSQDGFTYDKIYDLFVFGKQRKLYDEILKPMVAVMYEHPNMDFESILVTLDFKPQTMAQLKGYIPLLKQKFKEIRTSSDPGAELRWVMANLRKRAYGNVCMEELRSLVEKEVNHG